MLETQDRRDDVWELLGVHSPQQLISCVVKVLSFVPSKIVQVAWSGTDGRDIDVGLTHGPTTRCVDCEHSRVRLIDAWVFLLLFDVLIR